MIDPTLRDLGWIGVLIWLLAEKMLPILKDRVLPMRAAERKAEIERKANLEERQVKALEEISKIAHSQNAQIAAVSEKVDHVKGDTTVIRDNTVEIKAYLTGQKRHGGMARPMQ